MRRLDASNELVWCTIASDTERTHVAWYTTQAAAEAAADTTRLVYVDAGEHCQIIVARGYKAYESGGQ